MTARLARLLLAALVVSACSTAAPAAPPEPTPAPTADPGYVTKVEYGAAWPFTVSAGTLSCSPSGRNDGRLLVTFDAGNGIEYALNGSARSFGFPELDTTIMPAWPDGSGLGDLIARGLELCN